ncbi:MAG: cytochrome c [Rhodospirillaceae bacterium]|nr:cytochrome c [Rhodospirillaceae bacterium]
MKQILRAALVLIAIVVVGGIGVIYSGVYNIAATDPHWSVVYRVLETMRDRSIEVRARDITVRSDLDDQARIVMGTEHYAAHCAVCHGAPGVEKGEIAEGLYPQPPNLAHSAEDHTPAELFWILKNGIKMTGMPAWSAHSDDELWATVAFLMKLPGMTEEEYGKLVMATLAMGGHRHSGPESSGEGGAEEKEHEHAPAPK